MKCGNFPFLLCPLCLNLPHQLQQSVISQNDFNQLPENLSLQRQPMFPFSPGGARLINRKTIRYIITISNAIFRLLCSLESFADVAHLQMSQARPSLCLASFSTIVQQWNQKILELRSAAIRQCRAAVSRPAVCGRKVACVSHKCKDIAPFTKKSWKILNEKHLHHYKLRVKVIFFYFFNEQKFYCQLCWVILIIYC